MVNATFLNLYKNQNIIKNYIMLIHTSVKMENHAGDRRVTEETLSELAKRNSKKRIKYLEKITNTKLKVLFVPKIYIKFLQSLLKNPKECILVFHIGIYLLLYFV